MDSNTEFGLGLIRGEAQRIDARKIDVVCESLSQHTSVRFRPVLVDSYRELIEGITRGTLGIARMPPIPSAHVRGGSGIVVVVPVRRGRTHYHTTIIMKRGKTVPVMQLRGKSIAWVDQSSASGYIVPRLHLSSIGLEPSLLFAKELFVGSHTEVVRSVLSGRVDAGATYCNLETDSQRIVSAPWIGPAWAGAHAIDVVVSIGPIPNDAVVASAKLPVTVIDIIAKWFLSPDDASRAPLLEMFQGDMFRLATPTHFEALDALLRAARASMTASIGSWIPPR